MGKWEYNGAIHRYDVSGVVDLGLGKVKVHDIFDETPDFMLDADFVFVDPPCSKGNLTSFYTKAEVAKRGEFAEFSDRLFEVIGEIAPNAVMMELFKSNRDDYLNRLRLAFPHVEVFDSTYYHSKRNRCWMAYASKDPIPEKVRAIDGMDEEDAIAYACRNFDFTKIADPCMGKGLVAFYASKSGRAFAGTELNPKRLAVCVERVVTGERGSVN